MVKIDTFINSLFNSNSYLIHEKGSKECCLIDCGDVSPVSDYTKHHGLVLKAVLLTHTHFDHIYGLNELLEHDPDVLVYTSEFGKTALQSDKLNLSRYNMNPFVFLYDGGVRILTEGELIRLFGNVRVEVFSTPGHDKSCLTYRVEDNIFSGDSFIPGIKVVASFPHSNKTEAQCSEQRIRQWAVGCNLYPGHGRGYVPYHPG